MSEWAYNPITGNLDRIGEGGGPGGNITISGDSGPPITADTFAFVGQEANGVPVMDVDTSTGDVVIANNSWQTQYVVDPSTTAGLKGTFTTWQDAIDKAFADGATVGNGICQNIFIRPGVYPEDPVVPDTAFLNFIGLSVAGNINGDTSGAVLQGNITFDPTVGINAYFENIAFTPTTGDAFSVPDGMGAVALKDCTLKNGTAGNALSIDLTSGTIRSEGCSFLGPCEDVSASFIKQVEFDDCTFTDTCTISNGSGWIVEDCQCVPFVCNDTSTLQIINGKMLNGVPWVSGDTTGDVVIKGTLGEGATQATNPSALIDTAGGMYVADIAFKAEDESFPMNSVYGSTGTPKMLPSLAGNIVNSKLVDDDYQMLFCDSYIGVTDTSAARAITLPANPVPDAYYIVKDESLGAGTNNITVQGMIDGVTDFVIDTNGGFLIVKADVNGDFFIIGNSATASPPASPAPWINVPGTSQAMTIWNKYIANNASLVSFALPTSAAFGTEVEVMGNGAGGWIITQAAGQSINYGIASTTIGATGSLASADAKDALRLVCVVANTTWNVASSQGNLTVS